MDKHQLRTLILNEHQSGTSQRKAAKNINEKFPIVRASKSTVAYWYKRVDGFFSTCTPELWAKGINSLPMRWEKVIENEGEYILD